MVRFATQRIEAGHLPLTSWFPFLGLGSPHFLHYQSLGAMITGLLGVLTGPNAAFRWSLYLLVALWPVCIYLAVRLFGAGRCAAAASAATASFLFSHPGVGFEQHAYLWIGYGVWAQLWASWTLPLAWGCTWQAIRYGRWRGTAAVLIALTIAFHYETGYLALLPLLLWPFVPGAESDRARSEHLHRRIRKALARAGTVGAGALLISAWVIVPLIDQAPWAGRNEALARTPLVNGYGASRVLGWLVSGGLLDSGRAPVVTLLFGVGVLLALSRWRADARARALLILLAGCLVLSFGRATWGALADLLPGAGDLFFRRFLMGVQLVGLLLAGMGAAWCLGLVRAGLNRASPKLSRRINVPMQGYLALAFGIGVLAPAWIQLRSYDARNAGAIAAQQRADRLAGQEIDPLIAQAKAQGGGRVYAGMPSDWGSYLDVGAVPVFKYLESRDADEVGYTLRTASLMSAPEARFEDRNPSDYLLFGIRYLLLARGQSPPVSAAVRGCSGAYCLWLLSHGAYLHLGVLAGRLSEDRTDIGRRSAPVLRGRLAESGVFVPVSYGAASGLSAIPPAGGGSAAGRVLAARDDLLDGQAEATVVMQRPGVIVLSASFDPGWRVSVDGHERPVTIAAPALVGATLPAGRHTVRFSYVGYQGYPWLFALAGLMLVALTIRGARKARR